MSQSANSETYKVTLGTKGPKWNRTAFVSGNQVYLPAATYFDSETEGLLCAGYDGEKVIRFDGHVYLTATFLAKEFKQDAEKIASAASNVLAMKQAADSQ